MKQKFGVLGLLALTQRQCVCVHVGQCGIQVGNALWELFCIEHGIKSDGTILENTDPDLLSSSQTFFHPAAENKMSPRVVMADLEPTVLDEIRTGPYKKLYHPDQLISGKEDAANNYARGHYTTGKNMLESVHTTISKVVEQCDSLQGFVVIHSAGGGTGSGFGTLIMDDLVKEYSRKSRLELMVSPAPQVSSAVVEPYNAILSTHDTLLSSYSDCTFMADNEALYEICQKKLNIGRPGNSTLNRMLAQVVSSVTASLRFSGSLNVDLPELKTNLVPFPRLHFPVTSYAPIVGQEKIYHEQYSVRDLTAEAFNDTNQLVKCDLKKGKFIACCLLYRGDIVPKDINSAIDIMKSKKNVNFVEWCQTGFKIGINPEPPSMSPTGEFAKVQRAVCMMANSTAIVEPWTRLAEKFDLMYNKRAFVHWFLKEGMDLDEFVEARTDIEMLQLDYLEVQEDLSPKMPADEVEF